MSTPDFAISLPPGRQTRVTCPYCADSHRKKKTLSVRVDTDGDGGVYKCFRCSAAGNWLRNGAAGRQFTAEQVRAKQTEHARQHADDAAKAAALAQRFWERSEPAPVDHPYLQRKGIGPGGLRACMGVLVAPVYVNGTLTSVQKITRRGDKTFTAGGTVRAGMYLLGSVTAGTPLIVCEGVATAHSLYEATGWPTAAAFFAGNLEPVATALRASHPGTQIVIAADDDHTRADNPGITYARKAAEAVGASVAVPAFGADRPDGATDFNDLAAARGQAAVREQLAQGAKADVGDKVDQPDVGLIDGRAFLQMISVPQYVARPTIQRGQTVAMTGRTNHGKTTIAHLHIVGVLTGRLIGSMKFKKGKVLLLVGENPANSALQFKAACRRYGVSDAELANLIVWPAPAKLSLLAPELRDKVDVDLMLVVIDTSTAFFSYDDENDNLQLHQHAQDAAGLTRLRGGPAVLILCHPVKNATQDNLQPRGGGAFLNAIDSNLTVWNDGECVTLHHTLMRGPTFEPLTFALDQQDVGLKDDEGASVIPLVASALSDDDEARLGHKRQEDENRVLYVMLAHPKHSIAQWAEDCGWVSSTRVPLKSKVARVLDRLKDDRLVKKYRGRYVLTDSGKTEAQRIN